MSEFSKYQNDADKANDNLLALSQQRLQTVTSPTLRSLYELTASITAISDNNFDIGKYNNLLARLVNLGARANDEFGDEERDAIRTILVPHFDNTDINVSNDDVRAKHAKKAIDRFPQPQFFKVLHFTGSSEKFENFAKAGLVSLDTRKAYTQWKRVNAPLISKWAQYHEARRAAPSTPEPEPVAANPVIHKINTILGMMETQSASYAQMQARWSVFSDKEQDAFIASPHNFLITYAVENFAQLDEPTHAAIRKELKPLFHPEAIHIHREHNHRGIADLPPHILFPFVRFFKFEAEMAQAVQDKVFSVDAAKEYAQWAKQLDTPANGQADVQSTLMHLNHEYKSRRDAATSPAVIKLYDFLLEISGGIEGMPQTPSVVQYTATEAAQKQRAPNAFLMEFAVNRYTEFGVADRLEVRNYFQAMFAPAKPLTQDQVGMNHIFFSFSHLYGLEKDLKDMIARKMLPTKTRLDYQNWEKTNHRYVAMCKDMNTFPATGNLMSAAATDEGFTDEVMAEYRQQQYEEYQRNSTELTAMMNIGVEEDDVAKYMAARDEAQTPVAKKVYDLMVRYCELTIDPENVTPLKAEYTPEERRQFSRDIVLFMLKFAEENYAHIDSKERQVIAKHMDALFTHYDPIHVRDNKGRMNAMSKPVLFRYIHLYGHEMKFQEAMDRKEVPVNIKLAYVGWCKANQAFINECADKENGVPVPKDEQAATYDTSAHAKLKHILDKMAALREAPPGSHSEMNAKLFVQEKALVALVRDEKNFEAFTKQERVLVHAQLRATFLTQEAPKDDSPRLMNGKMRRPSDASRDMSRAGLEKLASPDLFACYHMYGLAEGFEAADKQLVSPKVRIAYAGWKRVNAAFVDKWQLRNITERQQADFADRMVTAENPAVAKLYGKLLDALRGHLEKPGFVTTFCEHVATHHDEFDADARMFASYQIKAWINPPGQPTERQRVFWRDVEPDAVIRAASALGLDADMDEARQKKGFMPDDIAMAYWLFKNQPPEITAEVPAVTFEEIGLEQGGTVDSRLTHIDVDHAMVVSGNKTESMGMTCPDAKEDASGDTQDKGKQERTKALYQALLKDGGSGVQHITVRWDKRDQSEKDGKKPSLPYNLVDIDMKDGTRSRVMVCDYFGNMTYVQRDAPAWKETDILQISDLRKDNKVWTAIHLSDKQWVSLIQKVLYTPLDKLEIDPKTRNSRWGLKGALTETFARSIVRTGTLPTTSTPTLVKDGPLAGRYKWSSLYNAVNAGDISGVAKGTTWRTLYADLTRDGGEYPGLKEFMGRTEKITAGDIHVACTRFQQEFDLAVQSELYDDINVRGLSGHAVDLAIKFGEVAGWEKYLPEGAPAPQDLEDFVVRSGLAQRQGMQLIAA